MVKTDRLADSYAGKEGGGILATLGWGAFLGTSWTWVIGMVLPALLIRDMGMAGFLAFALPNCIGAAAMGVVLTMKSAKELITKHRGMILTFSIVTVAYHFYIAGFLLPSLLGVASLLFFALGGLCALGVMLLWKDKGAIFFALAVWIISMTCFLISLGIPEAEAFLIFKESPLLDASYTWFFLPASISGFLLCPYLDATFIRARAKTKGKNGVWAFALGFLVFFAAMIIFTTAYGHTLLEGFAGEENRLTGIWGILLTIHLPMQMGLTVAWHSREIYTIVAHETSVRERLKGKNIFLSLKGMVTFCTLLFFIIFLLGVLLQWISFEQFQDIKIAHHIEDIYEAYELDRFMSVGEIGYRCLLIFYGTLFPAYVFLMMVPNLARVKLPHKPWWIFTFTVILSAVTGYMGFVLDLGWAIALTILVICIGRVLVERKAWQYKKSTSVEVPE